MNCCSNSIRNNCSRKVVGTTAKEIFVPAITVGRVVPTMLVRTPVPTRVVGTATKIFVSAMIVGTVVPTIIVGTVVPTIIVLMSYFWKFCHPDRVKGYRKKEKCGN